MPHHSCSLPRRILTLGHWAAGPSSGLEGGGGGVSAFTFPSPSHARGGGWPPGGQLQHTHEHWHMTLEFSGVTMCPSLRSSQPSANDGKAC